MLVLDVYSAIQYGIIDVDLFPRGIKAAIEIMSINQLRVPNTSLSFLPQRNCECQQAEDCEKRRIPLHDALVFQRETS